MAKTVVHFAFTLQALCPLRLVNIKFKNKKTHLFFKFNGGFFLTIRLSLYWQNNNNNCRKHTHETHTK